MYTNDSNSRLCVMFGKRDFFSVNLMPMLLLILIKKKNYFDKLFSTIISEIIYCVLYTVHLLSSITCIVV